MASDFAYTGTQHGNMGTLSFWAWAGTSIYRAISIHDLMRMKFLYYLHTSHQDE